tara:strand:- start:40 stop:219 length:180 start_codon:yes stop_codon:yes gene_type:complete
MTNKEVKEYINNMEVVNLNIIKDFLDHSISENDNIYLMKYLLQQKNILEILIKDFYEKI